MTPQQQSQYESDRARADAVYQLSMMETNAIITRARMPAAKPRPPVNWWRRAVRVLKRRYCLKEQA